MSKPAVPAATFTPTTRLLVDLMSSGNSAFTVTWVDPLASPKLVRAFPSPSSQVRVMPLS